MLKYPLLINLVMGIVGRIELIRLNIASRNPRKAQEKTLRKMLYLSKDTVYGREHHFAEILDAKTDIELYARYQQYVHKQDYEKLRPYVNRAKMGAPDILFPGHPVMYATTSGTTAEPKWIPITKHYLKRIYGKMTRLWLFNFIRHRQMVFSGSVVIIVGKAVEGRALDGTVFGSVSGLTRKDVPQFIKKHYAFSSSVYDIPDYNARYYAIMRLSIEQDVTMLVTANPSTIVEMQHNAIEYYDKYVEDIENGTINKDLDIPLHIRQELEAELKPNPKRAAELRRLKEQYYTPLPRHYWPNLQTLSTWKCGNTKVYLDKFQGSFPDHICHQEIGYFSSECRFGFVMDEGIDTTLFPHFHYYEFIAEEDLENPNPRFWQLYELEEGKRYSPIVTTYAGLYRYDVSDLVEVGPKYLGTPTIHMVQKVNGIVSITGEKLQENQFMTSVQNAEKELDMPTKFSIAFADVERSTYHFYFEFANQQTSQEDAERFAAVVDTELKNMNIEYEAKRDSLRLKQPITHRLRSNAFDQFKQASIADGSGRDGQFKLNLLLQDEKRHAKFKRLALDAKDAVEKAIDGLEKKHTARKTARKYKHKK
jgi:hypothetical protein